MSLHFSVHVNGRLKFTVGAGGRASFGVHINGYSGRKKRPRVHGTATRAVALDRTEFLTWDGMSLKNGDVVTVECSTSADASAPNQRFLRGGDESDWVPNADVSKRIIELVLRFQGELIAFVPALAGTDGKETARRFKIAVGHVLSETYERILRPVYDAHPALKPESE